VDDELFDLLAPTVTSLGVDLVDVERRSGLVRVVVDREGGADLDVIADVTKAVSEQLDRHDPHPGHRYTLEVSSPGVERPLRTPDQFARAVGETVSVRTMSGPPGERRMQGTLTDADADGFVVDDRVHAERRRFSYAEVDRVRTVFEWPATSRAPRGARGGKVASR